ncbi:MAG: cyanophycinase, partial [Bacteroidia bacterium]|nr:cyanophycinase [Bacteroidia bacterium]
VWFSGGRQWRHADSYLNTKTHEAFWDVLNRGGVIAGSSAGATIQGSYLARGDTKANTIMMGDHEAGLGFMTNVAIDQHLFARNRQFDMFEILDRKPELLGIGLDEDTGIVVQGDRFRVFGNSYVVVYDRTRWSRERDTIYHLPQGSKEFYLLKRGEEYDLSKRKIVEFGERKFINLSDEELKIYAGTYTSENGARTIDLVREEGKLFLHQQRNNQRHQLYPESTIHFVRENSNFTLDFRMSEGEIEGLYLPLQDLHLYKK